MQFMTITGNVGQDPKIAQTRDGQDVCNLSVGVRQGWGDKEQTNWFRVAVWGKRAKTVSEHINKGTKVTVAGEFSLGSYEGKPQLEIRAADIDWTPTGERKQERQTEQRQSGGGPNYQDDLDDSVPFLTMETGLRFKRII
jgi:single-strand DNA-binding protein